MQTKQRAMKSLGLTVGDRSRLTLRKQLDLKIDFGRTYPNL